MTATGMKCGGCPIKLSLALNGVCGVDDVQATNGHDPRHDHCG
jgi:copper chaperone CopZ